MELFESGGRITRETQPGLRPTIDVLVPDLAHVTKLRLIERAPRGVHGKRGENTLSTLVVEIPRSTPPPRSGSDAPPA
jgi:hypothetical protein